MERLYPWQRACLGLDGVFDHTSNLVYCAPTSGGKSLVSDTLLIRRLHSVPGSIGIMVLPFVSLCRERADELERMLGAESRISVRRFFGGGGGRLPPPDGGGGLLVCTPEKFNDVMTRLIEEERVRELSSVVVDELHMVQDPSRGGTLELALTKLLFAARKTVEGHAAIDNLDAAIDREEMHDHLVPLTEPSGFSGDFSLRRRASKPQIIGMSATLADVDGLARWFDAKLFETDFRPVPLRTHIVTGGRVFSLRSDRGDGREDEGGIDRDANENAPSLDPRRSRALPPAAVTETDHAVELVREGFADEDETTHVTRRGGVIVFCAAKFQCEATAGALVHETGQRRRAGRRGRGWGPRPGLGPDASDPGPTRASRAALVDELRRLQPHAADIETEKKRSLATCASRGVVWHHSGAARRGEVRRREGLPRGRVPRGVLHHDDGHRREPPREARGDRQPVRVPQEAGAARGAESARPAADGRPRRARGVRRGRGRRVRGVPARAAEVRWTRRGAEATSSRATPRDADALALEIAERLSSDGEALSSTIAQAGMRRVMLEAAAACGLARDPGDIKRYIQCALLNALNDFKTSSPLARRARCGGWRSVRSSAGTPSRRSGTRRRSAAPPPPRTSTPTTRSPSWRTCGRRRGA